MATHHVHTSIASLLNRTDDELSSMFNMDGQEARKELLERQANGELLVGSENCEGFDPIKGCPGHEENKYPIGGYAPGNYLCKCCICSCEFQGDKRAVQCEPCAEKAVGNLKDDDQIIANQMAGMSIEEAIFQAGFTRGHNVGYERMKREAEQGVIHQRKDTVEEEWESFWKEIVTNEDGTINIEQIKKELADFSFVMEQVPKVYCHITGDAMSKVIYKAEDVIRVADDHFNKSLKEALKDEQEAQPGAVWVKASERLPAIEGRIICKRLGEPIVAFCQRFKDGSYRITNGRMQVWVGWKEFEWLDESGAAAESEIEQLKAEIERRNKIMEDDLKLHCRLNMPGISDQEQECAWAMFKLKNNL